MELGEGNLVQEVLKVGQNIGKISSMALINRHALRSTSCHAIDGQTSATSMFVARRAERRTKARANKGYSVREGAIRREVGPRTVKKLSGKQEQHPMKRSKDKQPIGEERVSQCCPH